MKSKLPSASEVQHTLDNVKATAIFSDRYPVYQYKINLQNYILKFVTADNAQSHQLNTALFQFSGLPFVDCDIMQMSEYSRLRFYKQLGHPANADHVIIMPLIDGMLIDTYIEKGDAVPDVFFDQVMDIAPEAALAGYDDFDQKNVILQNSMNICLLDAGEGLMTKRKRHKNIENVFMGNLFSAFGSMQAIPISLANNLQQKLPDKLEHFVRKVDAGLPEPLVHIKNLPEKLLRRADDLGKINIVEYLPKPKYR